MTIYYDYLIRNAKVFDGSERPVLQDVAVKEGRIVARATNLPVEHAEQVIDATNQWLMPGLLDIHTHYDLELEVAPGLPESTRHGTTSVVIANCSLGLAFGAQRKDNADPIVDCYARVENVPKKTLRLIADQVNWDSPAAYLKHLDQIPLGPNVAVLYPHSMLRIETMGFDDSISRDPTPAELHGMQHLLAEGIDLGYVGFSTDALPFHYLANQPNCHKTIPTQFARYAEVKALTDVVRERGAVWQATPPKDNPLQILRNFALTSGRFFGKPLKTTVVAAMDIHSNRNLLKLGRLMARIFNSRWINGKFYLQALGAPFKVWADGPITPLAEEIPELRKLNETELEDREGRLRILKDPQFIRAFKAMWMKGKRGFSVSRLKRWLRLEDYALTRDLGDMTVDVCPLTSWQGQTFEQLLDRVLAFNGGTPAPDINDEEKKLIERDFFWIADEADFVIQMLRTFDTDLSWHTVSANRDPATIRKLLMDPLLLPGFNDSGAHLTNMAFYDVNLRALKAAAEGGDRDVAFMVRRLTRDPAEVFGIEAGSIEIGDRADLILINPDKLNAYDGEAGIKRQFRQEFDHEQLVNRSDGVVPLVMIGGGVAWQDDRLAEDLGKRRFGRLLRGQSAA